MFRCILFVVRSCSDCKTNNEFDIAVLVMFPSKGLFRNVFFQPYNDHGNARIQDAAKNSKHLVQRFTLEKVLESHTGCVNSVQWNETGSLLLTAGDDKRIVITHPFSYKVVVDYKTKHKTNIFCAKFLPTTDNRIISCGGDGSVLNLDLERLEETEWNFFTCHSSPCYELETIPGEPNIFLSCGEDGTIRQYDLRSSVKCSKKYCFENVLIDCGKPVSTIAINPIQPYQLAIATVDSTVRIIDRRKILKQDPADKLVPECSFTVPHLSHRSYRITSLAYSPDGRDMLANYSNEEVYLFSLDKDPNIVAVVNDFLENAPCPPPYKRIRLRGDWADTGPLSRPTTDSQTSRMQSAVMTRMSDMLIHVFNTPSLRSVVMQNWRPNYSPAVAISRLVNRNQYNSIEPQNDVPVSNLIENEFMVAESSASIDNVDQPSSNRNDENVENQCVRDGRFSGFDDFVPLQPVKAQYKGHRNARTLIKEAVFWGNDFIMSGSDCGYVFIWDRYTREIVMLLKADSHVVNCVQPHPTRPLLATSGIDHNVKLWSPMSAEKVFSPSFANELVERNKLMMEESRDTITVSPTLLMRMLAYFNQMRRVRQELQTRVNSPIVFRYIDNHSMFRREDTESSEEQSSGSSHETDDEIQS